MDGNWLEAQLASYGSSGLGIKNLKSGDINEGSSPEHAVDNEQILDILVYQLPTGSNWTFSSLSLGWIGGADASPEINVWVGGAGLAANYDFRNVCFVGCTGAAKQLTDSSLGFTYAGQLNFSGTGTVSTLSASTGTEGFGGPNPSAAGQYIVIAASVTAGTLYDAFKVKGIDATGTTTTKVPEPGILALLAGGLLGLGLMRRRASV